MWYPVQKESAIKDLQEAVAGADFRRNSELCKLLSFISFSLRCLFPTEKTFFGESFFSPFFRHNNNLIDLGWHILLLC